MVTWLDDLESRTFDALPPYVSGYFAMTAGSGSTHRNGIRDWSAMHIRPGVPRAAGNPSTDVSVLGTDLRTPVLIAPTAQAHAAHPDGEIALARAAVASGTLLGVSTHTAHPFADISATGAPWWLQVYVMRDRGLTTQLVARAVDAGAKAILLTVDLPTLESRAGHLEPANWPDRFLARRGANLELTENTERPAGRVTADDVGPDDIGWLRDISGLPVVVKGILRASDARICTSAGAAGILVSTHGGRAADPSITAPAALPGVVAALAGSGAEVYVDSGLRSGAHVFAALALGARAVFVGRPMLWGLTTGGSAGVAAVVDTLTRELGEVMSRTGAASLGDIASGMIDSGP